ncbi:MAG: glutamate formiminotransferase [Candidatus Aquidulcis sp.]|nr:MAG: glutamate formiminotransferase [Candidatus Aquidulcis sp.]
MTTTNANFEIVANISEGRNPAILQQAAAAIRAVSGVTLRDVHTDADHDRSVFTYVGAGGVELVAATLALARIAVASIDLSSPAKSGAGRGVHPRIGAIDVVPVVPISLTATLEQAAEIARVAGAALATTLSLPVHLYGAAARNEDRRSLPTLRRGGFEQLAAHQAAEGGAPDFGPLEPHPTAGATAVGARTLMAAWNIELAGADAETLLQVSKEIAREIRGTTPGGVRELQALGFPLASKGIAQVSMNLHDLLEATDRGDTLHAIRERIRAAASSRGVEIGQTEVVGLLPERALHAGGNPAALQISGGWERVVLER